MITLKKILLLAAFVLIAGAADAQGLIFGPSSDYYNDSNNPYKVRMGFEAGIGTSNTNLSGGNATSNFSTGSLKGLNAGFTFDIPVTAAISIAPEVLYSQKGFDAVTINGNFTQRTQYIDVPLLAKLRINKIVSFYAGPQFSYLAGLSNNYQAGFAADKQSFYNNSSTSLYFDGVVGASLSVTNNIDLRARYTIGLQQNYSNGNNYVPNYTNQGVQFSVGYKF